MRPVSEHLASYQPVDDVDGRESAASGRGVFMTRTLSENEGKPVICPGDEEPPRTPSRALSDMSCTPMENRPLLLHENESEWLRLGTFSSLPPEMLCNILSYLPLKDINSLLCTAKVFNNCYIVRESYLKYAVDKLCHRYFGDLRGSHNELERKRRHFSLHMDEAIKRLRQVAPGKDIDLMETTLRKKPLYTGSLLRKLSNDGRLTCKARALVKDCAIVNENPLINLPGTSKLISVASNLTVWNAAFETNDLPVRIDHPCGGKGGFLEETHCDVFPDGRVALSSPDGLIQIFDLSRSISRQLVRKIQPPGYYPNNHSSFKVITNDIMVAASNGSLWLFDLCRPERCELLRKLRHSDTRLIEFSGFLSTGELVSFDRVKKTLKVWQSLRSYARDTDKLRVEKCINSIEIRSDALLRSMTLNHAGKVALWARGMDLPILIIDVNRSAGQEYIGSIELAGHHYYSCCAPVNTPNGQLLAAFTNVQWNVLTVWQLNDGQPTLLRQVQVPRAHADVFTSVRVIPDGRVLAMSKNRIYIIDLTKPEGEEVTGSGRPEERNGRVVAADVSGELSVLAYYDRENSIQLIDYCAV